MKKFYPLIILIILILAGGIYAGIRNWKNVPEKELPITEKEITRSEVVLDAMERIGEISPVKPVLGGNWYVTRFWFVQTSNKDFYLEYEDGHIMRQILLEAYKENNELGYKVVGYFEPGETSWKLKDGEDKFFGKLLDLYEYDEEINAWVKKN